MTIISVSDLVKIYGSGEGTVYAVKHINFALEAGAFCVICGASGSGKSTLLELCGGMLTPTAGKIVFDGDEITRYNNDKLSDYRLNKVGFVFQQFNLVKDMTVKENISLPALIADRKAFGGQLDDLSRQMGISERLDHFPDQISGGERQRCAIARALMNDPHLLLADEPTGNLDSVTSSDIIELLLGINKKGTTIVLVTHDLGIRDKIPQSAPNGVSMVMKNGELSMG